MKYVKTNFKSPRIFKKGDTVYANTFIHTRGSFCQEIQMIRNIHNNDKFTLVKCMNINNIWLVKDDIQHYYLNTIDMKYEI